MFLQYIMIMNLIFENSYKKWSFSPRGCVLNKDGQFSANMTGFWARMSDFQQGWQIFSKYGWILFKFWPIDPVGIHPGWVLEQCSTIIPGWTRYHIYETFWKRYTYLYVTHLIVNLGKVGPDGVSLWSRRGFESREVDFYPWFDRGELDPTLIGARNPRW